MMTMMMMMLLLNERIFISVLKKKLEATAARRVARQQFSNLSCGRPSFHQRADGR
jgi:hypothetical protein